MDFSVIIPAYNRPHYLRMAIASVLRQKGVSLEVVVCDDSTNQECGSVVRAFKDKRIKYYRNRVRLGPSMNFQKCFLKSSGNYIFTLGDDDFILDDITLKDILSFMKRYRTGIARIGAFGFENSPLTPYQIYKLSDEPLVFKPGRTKDVLTQSIPFGLGFFSGLVFDNKKINRALLHMDHKCYPSHYCQSYHQAAYDLIKRFGIGYIPKHFIVGGLSLQSIPRYFNIAYLGRFFMEDPILLVRPFVSQREYGLYTRKYLRWQTELLPSIKYFTGYGNYARVLKRMIYLDSTLLATPKFLFYLTIGLLPSNLIRALRRLKIIHSRERVYRQAYKDGYFRHLNAFDPYYA